jgi:hypothetical protein
MSGGSLDYLYHSDNIGTSDLWKLEKSIDRLSKLVDEGKLKTSDKGYQAYQDLKDLHLQLSEASKMLEPLRAVLHDIEWEISGDYSEENLIECLDVYERR